MLRKLHSIRLQNSVSGLAGANGRLIALDASTRKVHSLVVESGILSHVSSVVCEGSHPWQRTFPLIEQVNDYLLFNNPDCVLTQDGDLAALSTPDAPVQLLSVPDLRISGKLGEAGEAKGLCFIGVSPKLIATRIAGTFPHENLHGEAFWFEPSTRTRNLADKTLIGRNIECNAEFLLTWSDWEGETQIYRHQATPPFRTHDIRMICYVRPDGIAVSRHGRFAAAVELDYYHKLIVIDTATCQRKLLVRYAGETSRPEHALNLSLCGFDSADGIYAPSPGGLVVRFDLTDGRKDEAKAHAAELTGLVTIPDQNLLVSSDADGTISLWACEASQRDRPKISDNRLDLPFLKGDGFTRDVDFGDEQFAFAP